LPAPVIVWVPVPVVISVIEFPSTGGVTLPK